MAKPERRKSLEQIRREMDRLNERELAAKELDQLWTAWMETVPGSAITQRTVNAVYREMQRIEKEIWDQGKIADVAERFNLAKEQAIAASLPKKRVTYLQTLEAVQDLLELSRSWQHTGARSRPEQQAQLLIVRRILLEISNGHLEDLAQRFQRQEPVDVSEER